MEDLRRENRPMGGCDEGDAGGDEEDKSGDKPCAGRSSECLSYNSGGFSPTTFARGIPNRRRPQQRARTAAPPILAADRSGRFVLSGS